MTDENETDHDAITCLLSEREQAERAEMVRAELFPGVRAVEELPDGYGFRFPAGDDWIAKVLRLADAERRCCPFFTIEVIFEPHGQGIWLRFRGSAAIKEFVRDAFPLSAPSGQASG